jgi:hypothetical protein
VVCRMPRLVVQRLLEGALQIPRRMDGLVGVDDPLAQRSIPTVSLGQLVAAAIIESTPPQPVARLIRTVLAGGTWQPLRAQPPGRPCLKARAKRSRPRGLPVKMPEPPLLLKIHLFQNHPTCRVYVHHD